MQNPRGNRRLQPVHPIRFLLIRSEVLHHGDDALPLHGLDLVDRHRPRQVRVFAEVLEVASQQRIARQVDARSLEDVEGEVVGFRANDLTEEASHRRIEGGGDCGRRRECRCLRGRRVREGAGPGDGRIDAVVLADPHRSVGNTKRRDAERCDPADVPRPLALWQFGDEFRRVAHQLLLLLFERHRRDQLRRAVGGRQRRVHPRQRLREHRRHMEEHRRSQHEPERHAFCGRTNTPDPAHTSYLHEADRIASLSASVNGAGSTLNRPPIVERALAAYLAISCFSMP